MEEAHRQSKAFDLLLLHGVDKLALDLVDYVEVANDLGARLVLDDAMLLLLDSVCQKSVANANLAFGKEVHLYYLVFLIEDDTILLSGLELTWHEAKAQLEQELGLFCSVYIEESLKHLKHIVK